MVGSSLDLLHVLTESQHVQRVAGDGPRIFHQGVVDDRRQHDEGVSRAEGAVARLCLPVAVNDHLRGELYGLCQGEWEPGFEVAGDDVGVTPDRRRLIVLPLIMDPIFRTIV